MASEGGKLNRPKRLLVAWRSSIEFALGSVRFWWIVCLCYAAIFAWGARQSMNPDGMSYIDMASAFLAGGPSKLVNGLWSPGYPALIGIAFFLFRPSPIHEFVLVHLLNILLFAFALWAFSVFFRIWSESVSTDGVEGESAKRYLTPFAYCTFLWFTLRLVGVENVTPDLGVVAAVFFAAAIGCRLFLPGASWKHYAALGFVLGAGYSFKAIVLPLGVALLVILFFTLPRSSSFSSSITRRKLFLSLSLSFLVLLIVASPLLAGLSMQAKRLSFGDAGRVNYLWHVNKVPWSFVQSNNQSARVEHPLRVVSTAPLTWQFSGLDNSTYPLGYEATYWWAGVKPRLNVRQQVAELNESLSAYKEIILVDSMPFFAGLMVLYGFSLYEKTYRAAPGAPWWQVAWVLAACLMYALVHTEPRYVSPFLALFCLALYAAFMFRLNSQVIAAVCSTVLLTVMIPLTVHLANVSVGIVDDLVHPRMPEYQVAALGLRNIGLEPGDRLAIVGDAYDCYYARYDRLHVVAQIPDAREFWRLNPPEVKLIAEQLASIGVKAIVASGNPDFPAPANWKIVQGSNAGQLDVLLLSPAKAGAP